MLQYLQPDRGGVFVDCTVGLGGHSRALLEAGATRIIGLDRDLERARRRSGNAGALADRVELVHADYRELDDVLDRRGVDVIDGALADLGVSSMQFDARGPRLQLPARRAAGHAHGPDDAAKRRPIWWPRVDERELADAIFQYGEERFSRRIARAIVDARRRAPIVTTGRLAAIVRRAFRAAASRASIRRRARFRRSASG